MPAPKEEPRRIRIHLIFSCCTFASELNDFLRVGNLFRSEKISVIVWQQV
jgi:hypothetical protein